MKVQEALNRPVPRGAFLDELLGALREMWEIPVLPEDNDGRGHYGLLVAGSVAAAAGVGAAGAWFGLRKRHRRGSVA